MEADDQDDDGGVRASALAMIGDGNSVEAVASVLRLPRASIEGWLLQPRTPPAAARPRPDRPPRVTPTDEPRVFRRWNKLRQGVVGLAFMLLMAGSIAPVLVDGDASWRTDWLYAACFGLPVWAFAYAFRSRVTLDADGVVRRGALLTRRLAYADIGHYAIRRGTVQDLYFVTLSSHREGRPGVTIFLDDDEIREPRIAAWLASLPDHGSERIEPPLVSATREPLLGAWATLALNVGLTAAAGLVLLAQMATVGADAFFRPPPLSSLERTAGTLVHASPCHDSGRGGEWTDVAIRTATGTPETTLPCTIHDRLIAGTANRQVEFYRDTRLFHHTSDRAALQFTLDGVVVQRYEDTLADRKSSRWSTLGIGVFGLGAVLSTLMLMLPGRRRPA